MDTTEGGKQSVLVLVTWSSSKAKSKLWAHANEKNQRIEIDKNNSMNHGNIPTFLGFRLGFSIHVFIFSNVFFADLPYLRVLIPLALTNFVDSHSFKSYLW